VSINFVFFATNFVNFVRPENWSKTEKCSKKIDGHFTEKRYMRLLLGIGYRIKKKY
jgi:hypothetical protein